MPGTSAAPPAREPDPEPEPEGTSSARDPSLLLELAPGAQIELARRRLSWFVRLAFANVLKPGTKLEWDWYLDAICDHAQAMFEDWLLSGNLTHSTLPGLVERVTARWRAHNLTPKQGTALVQNSTINVSPGTLKSVIVMVCFPAWVWLHAPGFQWGCSSGSPGNVTRDSDMHRDLVRSKWYRTSFGVTWDVRPDIDAKELWATTAGGSRLSRGIVAKWTGVHVDGLLLDDPDGAFTVFNETARRDVQGKWTNEMENRINDTERSFRIIVQQHVHSDDLSSHLLALGEWSPESELTRARWARLVIPMEFNAKRRRTTPFGWTDPRTTDGEVMHPVRFSRSFLASKREKLGSYGYEAQYNQAPELLDGGMYKRHCLRFFSVARSSGLYVGGTHDRPEMCVDREQSPAYVIAHDGTGRPPLDFLVLSVDASFGSTSASASNVGLIAMAGIGNRRFVLDDRTKSRSFVDTKADLAAMIGDWCPDAVLVEKKANGAAIIEDLRIMIADGQILDRNGKPVLCQFIEIEPSEDGGGKIARAAAASPTIEAGLLYLLDGASWVRDFVDELCSFPNGKKDDRVDATTQVINRYRGATSMVERWGLLAS